MAAWEGGSAPLTFPWPTLPHGSVGKEGGSSHCGRFHGVHGYLMGCHVAAPGAATWPIFFFIILFNWHNNCSLLFLSGTPEGRVFLLHHRFIFKWVFFPLLDFYSIPVSSIFTILVVIYYILAPTYHYKNRGLRLSFGHCFDDSLMKILSRSLYTQDFDSLIHRHF